MKKQAKRAAIFAVGLAFIPIGVVSLALPLSPGLLFLALAVILLSIASPSIQAWLERRTRNHPKLHRVVEGMQRRVGRFIGEE
ncbi:MAG: hypothetical protein Q8P19_03775 [bacterium]|nr:hypothetical protein [bacterium]